MIQTKGSRWRVSGMLVAGALALAGCGDSHDHDHGQGQARESQGGHRHDSPHGGVAVELGDHLYHLDFLADFSAGTLKVWVMDAHAENFVKVTNTTIRAVVKGIGDSGVLELMAQANPATGDAVGNTSQFEGRAEWLKLTNRFEAMIPLVELRGRQFTNVTFRYPAK